MATVTLILPLEATTVNNPSNSRSNSRIDSRGDSGAIAVVTVKRQQEHWQSKMEPQTQL